MHELIISQAQKEYHQHLADMGASSYLQTLKDTVNSYAEALSTPTDVLFQASSSLLDANRPGPTVPNVTCQVYPVATRQVRAEYLNTVTLKKYQALVDHLGNKLLGENGGDKQKKNGTSEIKSIASELEAIDRELTRYFDSNNLNSKTLALKHLLQAQDESKRIQTFPTTGGCPDGSGSSAAAAHGAVSNLNRLKQRCEDSRIDALFDQMKRYQELISRLEDIEIDYQRIGGCADLRNGFRQLTDRLDGADEILASNMRQLDVVIQTLADQTSAIQQLIAEQVN